MPRHEDKAKWKVDDAKKYWATELNGWDERTNGR